MELFVFEDELVRRFYPLTLTKPAFSLLYGARTILDSIGSTFSPDHVSFRVRDYLRPLVSSRYGPSEPEFDGYVLFANALLKPKRIEPKADEFILTSRGRVALAKLKGEKARRFSDSLKPDRTIAEVYEAPDLLFEYPWELISFTEVLKSQLPSGGPRQVDSCTVLGDPSKLVVKDSEVEPYCTFDTRNGPIFIDGAKLESGTRVEGPAYIGRGARLMGAKVKSSVIMEEVRLGGEVDTSVVEGYSNSAHKSYLGHSYVSSWVNVGAGSVTSDLKNTYGTVKMNLDGRRIDTGLLKLGSFIGEGVKASIGTMIYCGKRIGPFSHIHGYVLEDVPSFTIYAKGLGSEPTELYLESAIRTQRRMMARRGVELDDGYKAMMEALFRLTEEERAKAGVKKGGFKI